MPCLQKLLLLVLLSSLAACRMPVQIQGKGFIFGSQANEVYKQAYLFDINSDFDETFWPIPAPGHAFKRWTDICNTLYGPCKIQLNKNLWSLDQELPLGVQYTADYNGPLSLLNYGLYWNSSTRTLSIPADSIVLEGADAQDTTRFFMAPANLAIILPAKRVGGEYRFKIPTSSSYGPNDFWLIASSMDTDGTIASTAISFGLREQVQSAELHPHKANSPYANVLANCASANNPFALCPLQKLPFLGSNTNKPTVTDIMSRTVVSHGWMGQRFAQLLQKLPPDMLQMFRGITAVVITADIRPAFYTPATGAIYLDPQNLWLTPRERATISWEPDYRTGYGSEIQFIPAGLYVDGQKSAWQSSYSYPDGASRDIDEIIRPMANLLIHELAHANDAMPPALLPLARNNETPLDVSFRLELQTSTNDLSYQYPLRSSILQDIGAVLYQGAEATSFIKTLTPRQIGLEFEADDANDLYAYSTPYEDTAMLVEEVLTRYYFGLDRIVSFLDVPTDPDADCTQYTLRWGVRNRGSNPAVKERARLVLSGILGQTDVDHYVDSIPPTENLRRGIGLCQSLNQLSLEQQSTQGQFIPANFISSQMISRQLQTAKTHSRMQNQATKGRIRREQH